MSFIKPDPQNVGGEEESNNAGVAAKQCEGKKGRMISKHCGSFIWTVCVAAVWALCGFELVQLVVEFARDPTSITVTLVSSVPAPDIVLYVQENGAMVSSVSDFLEKANLAGHGDGLDGEIIRDLMETFMLKSMMTENKELSCPGKGSKTINMIHKRQDQGIYENVSDADVDMYKSILHKIFDSFDGNISSVYSTWMSSLSNKVSPMYRNSPISATLQGEKHAESRVGVSEVQTPFGVGYKLDVSNVTLQEGLHIKIVSKLCESALATEPVHLLGIGTDYAFPYVKPLVEVHCSVSLALQVRLESITYHKQLCRDKMENSCQMNCLIRLAEESGGCLPYFGIPIQRTRVPFCGFQSWQCDQAARRRCETECRNCGRSCQVCGSVKPEVITVAGETCNGHDVQHAPLPDDLGQRRCPIFDREADRSSIVEISLTPAAKIKRVHTTKMYSLTVMIAKCGGILGVGFGASIITIAESFFGVGNRVREWKGKML